MTKVMFNITDGGSVYLEVLNHAGDWDVCTIVSTICNFLVEAAFRMGTEPTIYNKGHVRIDIPNAPENTLEVFRTGEALLKKVQTQNPDYIKIY